MEIVSTHDNFIMYHSLRDGDLVETGEKPILADVSSYKNFFLLLVESIVNIQKKITKYVLGKRFLSDV